MSAEWRLIESWGVNPPESASIDEAILDAHARGDVPNTIHFYTRSRPTISLGHFQKLSETVDAEACRRLGVTVIRRGSGGGTIYTDPGQLIYALVVREEDLPPGRDDSFSLVCNVVAEAISSFGVDARFRPVNDVEIDGRKVSGSAQLRRRKSVLHHGTVLVHADLDTMDAVLVPRGSSGRASHPSDRVISLDSVIPSSPSIEEVKTRLTEGFMRAFNTGVVRSGLSLSERAMVERLALEKYSRDEWNLRY